ncbi:MAG: MOSC domain-containing protein [Cyclobacteriaceae bacterium]|nr:MOSC domain-containing protein [Cyclobacteriaceae bacterium]
MSPLTLSEIWIYPIKSFAGIRVKQAKLKQKGLEGDRRWMLMDETGRFITQREHPNLALFDLSIDNAGLLVVNRITQQKLVVDNHSTLTGTEYAATIWDDEVKVVEPDMKYSNWFSKQVGIACKLVFFPETNVRNVDPKYASNQEQVSLADGYPYLIIGQSSLNDLNSRLEVPVTMQRFRPNFVFTGGEAFEEDGWQHFKIGANLFRGVKRCARCVLTTVNPQTGEKGSEPLLTLSKYRKEENKIFFGQNVIALSLENLISEGDEITME